MSNSLRYRWLVPPTSEHGCRALIRSWEEETAVKWCSHRYLDKFPLSAFSADVDGVVATHATCSGIAEVFQTKVPEPIGPVLVGVATGALTDDFIVHFLPRM